jgi:hypothetical protein
LIPIIPSIVEDAFGQVALHAKPPRPVDGTWEKREELRCMRGELDR